MADDVRLTRFWSHDREGCWAIRIGDASIYLDDYQAQALLSLFDKAVREGELQRPAPKGE